MHSIRWLSLGAVAAAIVGAIATSPRVALAGDPACADGPGKVCEIVTGCYTLQGDECTAGDDSYKYYTNTLK